MILAIDFVISTRARYSAKHLLELMADKEGSWSYSELKTHPSLVPYGLDLTAIVSYLAEKNVIKTEREETKGVGVYQRKYLVNDIK